MFLLMFTGYLPWFNFSAVAGLITREIELSSAQVGTILAVFQLGYVAMVLFCGWLGDRTGEKQIVVGSVFLTGFFSILFALMASSYSSILILRLLIGVFAGGIYVPGMALLSRWFDPGERGGVLGSFIAALTLSYAGSYFITSSLAPALGWRGAVLLTSVPAVLAAGLGWFFLPRAPARDKSSGHPRPREQENIQPAPAGGYKGPAVITASYMGHMWELYAFWGWIGIFVESCLLALDYSRTAASVLGGRLAGLIIAAGVPAVWLLGWLGDRWGRSKTILICASCSILGQLILGFFYGQSLTLIVLVGIWVGFWVIADSPSFSAGLTEMTAPAIRGTALGVQNALGFSATILAPLIFGQVLELTNRGIAEPVLAQNWFPAFMVLGLGALLAPGAAFWLRRLPQARLMARGRK